MAFLFRPDDAMRGLTSDTVAGFSIVLPEACVRGQDPSTPLLDHGHASRKLITAGLQLAWAAAWQPRGSEQATAALVEALDQWCHPLEPVQHPERITAARRRRTVVDARGRMEAHLERRFSLKELSGAMGVSPRSLQYGFREELGRTPMAEAKRLRLGRLRQLLQAADHDQQSVSERMQAAGLLACGATAADDGHCWGESPRRTCQRRTMDL